jgi:hypothetical protein
LLAFGVATRTARANDTPIALALSTNRGCGPGAIFQVGDATSFDFAVGLESTVTLRLQRPDGVVDLLSNFAARPGFVYHVTGLAGDPIGPRTLTLFATATNASGQATCSYTVSGQGSGTGIGVTLSTDRGCGSNAVYHSGEAVNITFSTDRNAFVVLKLVGPNGTQTLKDNFQTNAGQSYPVTLTAGAIGDYNLVMDAGAEGRSGHIECAFKVDSPPQIGVTLTTDRGCGTGAVYRTGEAVNITFSTDRNAFVVLKLVGPNGTQTLKDNFVTTAGVLHPVTMTAGAVGDYTLIMDAGVEGRSGHIECTFRVEVANIVVTLTTDRGCGDNAVFRSGESVNITFSTDRNALVVLKLVGPNGTQFLKNNDVANGGVLYPVVISAGTPGNYQLILDAGADGRTGHIECAFRVEAATQIGVTLTTNRGCGSNAVFRTGDSVNITFATDRNALVVLKLVGPNGTQFLKNNDLANAGQSYPVTVIAGAVGNYTLIMDAGAEGRTGHAECAFRVDAVVSQIAVDVVTNKGCGTNAVFRPFEAMFFDFRVSQSSLVRFQIEMIGGGTQVLLNNFVAQPGFVYRLHTSFVLQGNFRVRVSATAGSAVGEDTCEFAVRN